MIRHIANKLHQVLSRSTWVVTVALLIRNQCNCILQYYLAEDANPAKNGEHLLVKHLSKHINNLIDVGANKGEYSEYFLTSNKNIQWILLIEPSEVCHKILHHKFNQNLKVEILKAAVSDHIGESVFFEEERAGETSSLINEFSNSKAKATQVNLTTIDAELHNRNIQKVDFLKIDTEGYDFHVLRGAKEHLKNHQIGIIQFEYNSPWKYAGSTLFSAIQFLKSNGYETFLLKSKGLYRMNYEKYGEFYTYSNFISVSPEFFPKVNELIRGNV